MSVIFEATCHACNSDLIIQSIELDADDDLRITVSPCQHCVKEALFDEQKVGTE